MKVNFFWEKTFVAEIVGEFLSKKDHTVKILICCRHRRHRFLSFPPPTSRNADRSHKSSALHSLHFRKYPNLFSHAPIYFFLANDSNKNC